MTQTNHHAFIDAQFKDNSPEQTVAHIKEILASYGMTAVESWHETSVPYCYALGLYIEGTTFSVNGKGLSREFAQASAYGELMERLQMGYIYTPGIQKDGTTSYVTNTAQKVPLTQILAEHGHWYQTLSKRLKKYTNISLNPHEMLAQYADNNGDLDVVSYFCLTSGLPTYYPADLRGRAYGSNGCAAGNTPEEAIVQALSEIVERNHMIRIIDGGISLPDVPEDVLKQYQTAYRIINYIREQGYRVVVKDCSLGKKFPVVCLYIIDTRTGRYHTHLGAYPIFEIALERALTESFQGRNIKNIARFEDFVFKKPGEFVFSSVADEIIKGSHEKTISFFHGEPTYAFNHSVGFDGRDNKSLLKECIEFFKDQGFDILVRDRSCLGFCTYQVIIPGYSETFLHRLCRPMNEFRYIGKAMSVLRNPSAAPLTDLLAYLLHENQMNQFTSDTHGVHGFLAHSKLSALPPSSVSNALLAASKGYIFYALGRWKEALQYVNTLIRVLPSDKLDFLICFKRYLSLKLNKYSEEDIDSILNYLHNNETVTSLQAMIRENKNPFDAYTLHCDCVHCDGCQLKPYCCQKRVMELAKILNDQNCKLDFEASCKQLSEILNNK